VDEAEARAARQAVISETFRAIGRYYVLFSALVYRMRFVLSRRLTIDRDAQEFGELPFSHAQAQQIVDAFFSMCRYDADLDESELAVLKVLNNAVNETVTERNNFAHGDWWTDLIPTCSPDDAKSLQLVRMQPKRREGPFAELGHWSAEKIDECSDRMYELHEHVVEFGFLALGLPLLTSATGGAGGVRVTKEREYRVGDVFTVRAGKGTGEKAQVLRNGPKAAEIVRVLPASPV
jgi:hypothetical protein